MPLLALHPTVQVPTCCLAVAAPDKSPALQTVPRRLDGVQRNRSWYMSAGGISPAAPELLCSFITALVVL